MSKKDRKYYICLHDTCSFKTDKRKAIYTHLIRTHSERKEDYECEYCSQVFEQESQMELHLHEQHPQQAFTYTCVSRIENVINQCAKIGSDSKREGGTAAETSLKPNVVPKIESAKSEDNVTINHSQYLLSSKPLLRQNSNHRTRASVNASLNSIAQTVNSEKALEFSADDIILDGDEDDDIDAELGDVGDDICTEEEGMELNSSGDEANSSTYVSEPSGLKIKLSLKKGSNNSGSRESPDDEPVTSPLLQSHSVPPPLHQLGLGLHHRNIEPQQTAFEVVTPRSHSSSNAQVRDKASKYYDKLEVYHSTDECGRRCCPFCDYKTSKNTIRVHLSGIHKIHFVKCSLCDYKAAFPHQITQHGLKFHKTTNLNVIQLSKESRERIIEQLKRRIALKGLPAYNSAKHQQGVPAQTYTMDHQHSGEIGVATNDVPVVDEEFNSDESYVSSADESGVIDQGDPEYLGQEPVDNRVFKAPICQTSKTDYYRIQFENGVYLYSCNLCSFKTPVRATIYTHKYRHEEKSYMCGYCDFTSAPRSNVVHHLRTKHKGLPVSVRETDSIPPAENDAAGSELVNVKTEPLDEHEVPEYNASLANVKKEPPSIPTPQDKTQHQPIIRVPQFKRSLPPAIYEPKPRAPPTKKAKLQDADDGSEYKLSLNKLYKVNPSGSPKFMCCMCSYACDTHPKMKHHLYRHRPQKYKCPYCDHRKYPRSYVVRHVRDTHRNKPIRVIDLSKGDGVEEDGYIMQDGLGNDDAEQMDTEDMVTPNQSLVKVEPNDSVISDPTDEAASDDTNEEVNELKKFAQKLNLRAVLTADLNDDIFNTTASTDVNSNYDAPSFTSTPLIESMINGQYQPTPPKPSGCKNFEKKKSMKDYRVNYDTGPRYICNICEYGTQNYKTIHNHMYRHESQRYQCPYCGYRRSPKSFVENHIREVHKGQPVIVTELTEDHDLEAPLGSPRQCVHLKRKDSPSDQTDVASAESATSEKISRTNVTATTLQTPKLPVKWPAPKPVNHVNAAANQTPPLLVKEECVEPIDDEHNSDVSLAQSTAPAVGVALRAASRKLSPPTIVNPLNFRENGRTTFKTMYKCTFDSEMCNHISKDKSKMKQHLFMHVEYKPWACDYCEMTASQSSHIKNHVRTEHPTVPDTSFRYKKHNYLEKHIEGFLTKGLFTVPVNEYRVIMDMKGNTKSSKQSTFSRDTEGNIECPYCNYKTKSGGMTDHVKMKHLQPRFKCHWCDYRAFYRSEVRKHHRKERSHSGYEFKTQELDLVQVVEGFRDKNCEGSEMESDGKAPSYAYVLPDEDDDDDGDDSDGSEESVSDNSSFGDYQPGYVEYTTEQLSELCSNKQSKSSGTKTLDMPSDKLDYIANLSTEITDSGCMVVQPKSVISSMLTVDQRVGSKASKFACGYCSFSAALRVKVKMHCAKKHSGMPLNVIDRPTKPESDDGSPQNQNNIVNVNSDELRGTKFEQDLRKAGVAKLNLASLFPHSKRFKKGDVGYVEGDENGDDVKSGKSENDGNDGDFKKPLEPPLSQKSVSKPSEAPTNERVDTSTEATDLIKGDQAVEKSSDESICTDKAKAVTNQSNNDSNEKGQGEELRDIETSDISKLDESKSETVEQAEDSNLVNDSESKSETDETDEGTKKEILTAYPHCTPVILESDGDSCNSCDSSNQTSLPDTPSDTNDMDNATESTVDCNKDDTMKTSDKTIEIANDDGKHEANADETSVEDVHKDIVELCNGESVTCEDTVDDTIEITNGNTANSSVMVSDKSRSTDISSEYIKLDGTEGNLQELQDDKTHSELKLTDDHEDATRVVQNGTNDEDTAQETGKQDSEINNDDEQLESGDRKCTKGSKMDKSISLKVNNHIIERSDDKCVLNEMLHQEN